MFKSKSLKSSKNSKILNSTLQKIINSFKGYELSLMSETTRSPRKIYIEITEGGLNYEVIGLDGQLKNIIIPWDSLPKYFPKKSSEIIKFKDTFLPIILEHTLKEGHTCFSTRDFVINTIIQENENNDLDKSFTQTKPEKFYLKPTILPSSEHWKEVKQKESKESNEISTKLFNEVNWWGEPFSLVSFSNDDKYQGKTQFVILIQSKYIYSINTEILGLNYHISNPNIFFSVSPNSGYYDKIINKTDAILVNQQGEKYLADIINYVKKSVHKNTNIACIVLGERTVKENMEAYRNAKLSSKENETQQIKQYHLSKEAINANTDVTVFNIDAHGHIMVLTSKDLELLYKIGNDVQKKDGTGTAIIVHCQQGMDRTGMLIFAMILFEKYNYYFCIDEDLTEEKSAKKSVTRIYKAYQELQESRSPVALTKKPDFINAIFLAHTLIAINLEKKSIANLSSLIIKDESTNQCRNDFILRLHKAKSNEEKLIILEEEFKAIEVMQKTDNYTSYKSETRRNRSGSCSNQLVIPLAGEFKKNNSDLTSVHKPREKEDYLESKPEDNIEIYKSLKRREAFYSKNDDFKEDDKQIQDEKNIPSKTKKENWSRTINNSAIASSELKISSMKIEDLSSNEEKVGKIEIKTRTNETTKTALPLILKRSSSNPEDLHKYTEKEKEEKLEIKAEENLEISKPLKTSGLFSSQKNKKRQSQDQKESNLQNALKNYVNELTCLKDAIQHRINTEDALQNRIQPKEETTKTLTISNKK